MVLSLASNARADAWTATEKHSEAAFLILQTIDYAQTLNIAKLCNLPGDTWFEHNAALGRCPSRGKVTGYFLLTTAAQIAVTDYLPHQWRRDFQNVSIGIEFGAVTNNFSIGISASF